MNKILTQVFILLCICLLTLAGALFEFTASKIPSDIETIIWCGIFIICTAQIVNILSLLRIYQKRNLLRISQMLFFDPMHEDIEPPSIQEWEADEHESRANALLEQNFNRLQNKKRREKYLPSFYGLTLSAKKAGILLEYRERDVFVTNANPDRKITLRNFEYSANGVRELKQYIQEQEPIRS